MKITGKLIIFVFAFLVLIANAYAQSPREELQQMVEQLQKAPNDNALREKIIQLAPTLKPSPVIPDTAITFEGRAQFAFRSATSEGDFIAAAQEYEKAVAVAPWVQGYYADLCTIYEKAGKFEDAKRHCGFYLISLSDPAQMTDVKRRIAGLEFGIEKTTKQAVNRAQEQRISGTWKYPHAAGDGVPRLQIFNVRLDSYGRWSITYDFYINNKQFAKAVPFNAEDIALVDSELRFKIVEKSVIGGICGTYDVRGNISADGNTLNLSYTLMPFAFDRPDEDCPLKSSYGPYVRTFKR